jgi:hypothetical protein
MIRVVKPKTPPKILATKGKAKRRAHNASYGRSAGDYDSGAKKFDFDSNIYGHKTVKELLIQAQHDKCFLCESKITHIAFGDVEHFRPKGGYRQSSSDRLITPGYYWLAYEWDNLLLACQLCNQLFKKNLFPLIDPGTRANPRTRSVKREQPLFINPSVDKPEVLISFRKEVPYPINDNPKGKATIEGLGLKRQKLNERRLERYVELKLLYDIAFRIPSIEPESSMAKDLLDKAVQDSAEYSNMARSAVAAKFALIA